MPTALRLVVHDFSGHPFQVQLSRELARRGHDVLHLHCPSYHSGKGALDVTLTDPPTLRIQAVDLGVSFAKYSSRRVVHELRYGQLLAEAAGAHRPDAVVSSNTPLLSQRSLLRRAKRSGAAFTFWQQDVYSTAMAEVLRAKIPLAGRAAGTSLVRLEARLLRESDAVVTISDDFRPVLRSWGIPDAQTEVIENWAPLDELPPAPRANGWSSRHGLTDVLTCLYAGTLGTKHDPGLLLELARSLAHRDDVRVVVVSEGTGADWLAAHARAESLPMTVLPFQPFEEFPEVLGSADVVVAILEAGAGAFSVPSKVLSYACAGRPVVAAIPRENLAAKTILQHDWGLIVEPDDPRGFVAATLSLLEDAHARLVLGDRARKYAERTFDISMIGDRFEQVILQSLRERTSRKRTAA